MLSDDVEKTLRWGQKAINLASRMDDQEVLSHALNNVGTVLMKYSLSEAEGEEKLNQSLSIALKNGFHEHAARAYANLSFSFVLNRQYEKAMAVFDVGLKYCEDRDLDGWKYYMYNCKSRLLFETGRWEEAESIARSLRNNAHHSSISNIDSMAALARLEMRRGKFEEANILIREAKAIAKPTQEAQRMIPVLVAELELAWLKGVAVPMDEVMETEDRLFYEKNNSWHYTDLAYWMRKCGLPEAGSSRVEFTGPFKLERQGNWKAAAELWKKTGCPYEEALALFEGDEEHQKQGLMIIEELGATTVSEILKSKLRMKGVRNIPRGPRQSTRNNPAQLTSRQVDVLFLLRDGLQNKEIADKLFISPKTVDHHISAILSQLDVNSRAKAVLQARKLGVLK